MGAKIQFSSLSLAPHHLSFLHKHSHKLLLDICAELHCLRLCNLSVGMVVLTENITCFRVSNNLSYDREDVSGICVCLKSLSLTLCCLKIHNKFVTKKKINASFLVNKQNKSTSASISIWWTWDNHRERRSTYVGYWSSKQLVVILVIRTAGIIIKTIHVRTECMGSGYTRLECRRKHHLCNVNQEPAVQLDASVSRSVR